MSWFDNFVELAHQQVNEGIVEALNSRGVSDDQITNFRLGYIDQKLPSEVEYPEAFLKWCHHGSKLDKVYVFPITNILNEVRGLQFRHVERTKSGYMDYFESKGEAIHFGLGQAAPHIWEQRKVVLVEGNFDVFPLQRHNPTVISVMTARVSNTLNDWLLRTVDEVYFGFDSDSTGKKGVAEFIKHQHRNYRNIVDLQLPSIPKPEGGKTKDPNELWEAWGDQVLGKHFLSKLGV